jgi:HAAS
VSRLAIILGVSLGRTTSPVVRYETVDAYVAALSHALRGPRRLRKDLVTEARDGLVDATEAYEADGLGHGDAERRAIDDFGELGEIAAAYRPELALGQARRTAVQLTLVIMLQPIVWADGRWPWNNVPSVPGSFHHTLESLVQWVGFGMFIAAVLGIAACGAGVRWASVRRSAARTTAVIGLVSALFLAVVATGLGLTGRDGSAGAGLLWTTLFVVAPSIVVARSAGRTLTLVTA